jgi:hypothetical protein
MMDCTKAGCLQLIAAVGQDDGAAVARLAKTKHVLNGQVNFTLPGRLEGREWGNWTALHECVRMDEVAMTKLLIDNRAKLEIQDADGYTPLFKASTFTSSELLEVLLDAGANPNAQSADDGYSCLMMAVIARDYETSKALLDAGANVSLVREDTSGLMALDLVALQTSGQLDPTLKVVESLDEAREKLKTLHALLLQYN